jgi:hypothetical protein
VAAERDAARAEVARRGLTDVAIGRVVRGSFTTTPVTMVDRAKTQLKRFFSTAAWTTGDDAALAAVAGPGRGWMSDDLGRGITIEHGWRGAAFRVEIKVAPDPGGGETHEPDDGGFAHERTLGDTFEDPLVLESGRADVELRFVTGLRSGGVLNASRDAPSDDPRVRVLFEKFDAIEDVHLEPGSVTVRVGDVDAWESLLLPLFDTISQSFITTRHSTPDRQLERATAELGRLDPTDPRDIAKILDAATSPDAAMRRVAVARLEKAETVVANRPWAAALDDQSRPVRRSCARAMAFADAPPPRALLERALEDKDAAVRYYALRGLARIGVNQTEPAVDRRRKDEDPRIRLAATAAIQGRTPA